MVGWSSLRRGAAGVATFAAIVPALHAAMDVAAADGPYRRTPAGSRWQDHPLGAWLLENAAILGVVMARISLPGSIDLQRRKTALPAQLLMSLLAGFTLIEGSVLAQKVLVDVAYAHLPHFHGKTVRARPSLGQCVRDWLSANFTVHTIGAGMAMAIVTRLPESALQSYATRRVRPFRVVPFLAKVCVCAGPRFASVKRTCSRRGRELFRLAHDNRCAVAVTAVRVAADR